jgi:photosystem II stability/assembly factor-like uncharacterized protein
LACAFLPGYLAAEIVDLEPVGNWAGEVRSVSVFGHHVYVLNEAGTVLRVLDAVDPANITVLDSLDLGAVYTGVSVEESGGERWGYLGGPVAPLTVKLTDPHGMSVWHQWPAGLQILAVESSTVYGRSGNDFVVCDASVPDAPLELSRTTLGVGIETWTRAGDLFYFMGASGTCEDLYHEQFHVAGIDRIDVTDPASPVRSSHYSCGGYCDDPCNIGNAGILLAASSWLQIGYYFGWWYHLAAFPAWTPDIINLPYPVMNLRSKWFDGHHLFWLAGGVLYVYNTAIPLQPVELATAPLGTSRFTKWEDRIYAWDSGGVDVWKIVRCPPTDEPAWTSQTSGTAKSLYGVSFSDANTGTAVGETGAIHRTTDGGETWQHQTSGTTQHLMDVYMSSALTGTAVGFGGTILRTENGGDTWLPQTSGTTRSLHDVCFTDPANGTVVGSGGTILTTADGGISWMQQNTGSNASLFGVFFCDSLSGYAVGNSGKILRTEDGGDLWTTQPGGSTVQLRSVFFCDPQQGWIAGEGGLILHTADGGTNWQQQATSTQSWLGAVSFADAVTGFATGGGGVILRTGDGGTSWFCDASGVAADVNAVFFIDAETAVAVGDNGTVLRWEYSDPTPVWIAGFDATPLENSIRLSWSVHTDEAIEGFRLYRRARERKTPVVLTDPPLPGLQRSYDDRTAQPGETYQYTLVVLSGASGEVRSASVEAAIPPLAARLYQNHPNPFNPVTTIRYTVPVTSHVELSVYTTTGMLIRTLVSATQQPGTREVVWDGADESGRPAVTGVYFCRFCTDDFVTSRKMVLLK